MAIASILWFHCPKPQFQGQLLKHPKPLIVGIFQGDDIIFFLKLQHGSCDAPLREGAIGQNAVNVNAIGPIILRYAPQVKILSAAGQVGSHAVFHFIQAPVADQARRIGGQGAVTVVL